MPLYKIFRNATPIGIIIEAENESKAFDKIALELYIGPLHTLITRHGQLHFVEKECTNEVSTNDCYELEEIQTNEVA